MIKFTINVAPITKKNNGQLIYNKRTGKPMVIPSKQYLQYEKDARWFMPHIETINEPVNIKAIFYVKTRHKVDLPNLVNALLDTLVKYQVIADDNRNIVYSTDGSRVLYDPQKPRTEVFITPIDEEFESWEKRKR